MRRLTGLLLVLLFLGAVLGPGSAASLGPPRASLPHPLRFARPLALDGLRVKSVEVSLGGGPVVVSDTAVAGVPGAVPGGDEVAVLWRGIEVGKGKAASDGSFSVPVPALPDARLSVMYGPAVPELRPSVNVALMVSGHVQGNVTASSSGASAAQACNGKFTDMWNANSGLPGWWLRDLGRELGVSGVRLWFGGAGSQCRWARVSLSVDGSSFVPVAEGSVTAPESRAPESPTLSLSLPAGTRARWVKVEADSGYDWTALVEAAVLGRVPATEILSAPEWTLPEGTGFSGRAAVVGQYGQPGLPWDAVSGWPDPGACWLNAAQAATRFRVRFSVPAEGDACLYAVGDDSFVAWLDGVPVLSGSGTGTAAATPLVLPAGEHVLAFECSNASGPGGLLVSLRRAGGEVVVRSGEGDWEYDGDMWLLPGSAGDLGGVPVVVPKNPAWTAGPDPGASWIWCQAVDASGSHPAGTVRFRRPFALAAAATVTVSVAADNSARVWVDGVAVLNWQSYLSAGSASLSLPAGDHVLAVEAVNASDPSAKQNPAGVLVSAKDASGAVLFRTGDSGWQTSGYVP